MPLLRTETGCRCRKTFVSITTTRLRRSRGAGCRKMLFHTCELRMKSPMAIYESLVHEESATDETRIKHGSANPSGGESSSSLVPCFIRLSSVADLHLNIRIGVRP